MNILHILSSDDKYGSAQCFLELLDHELKDYRVNPIVVTPRHNDINKKCDELGVRNYSIDYGQLQIPKHNGSFVFALKYAFHTFLYYSKKTSAEKSILSIIRENKVDIIHTNSCVIDIGATVAKKAGIHNIWHLREFGKQDFNFYPANPLYLKHMNEQQNTFLSISEAVTNEWVKRGLNKEKITTIYDGVEAKRFHTNLSSRKNDKKIHMVMCGSFCEAKNQKLLVEALSMLDNNKREQIILDFYGQPRGRYFEETRRLVDAYNLNHIITFQGYTDNIPQKLSNYDVGVICSRAEAFGRVTVEYMMSSLCTVASSSGANLEIIEENCGVLYKAGDSKSLARALSDIVNQKIDYRRYGERARILAVERFDISKNAEKIIELFMSKV